MSALLDLLATLVAVALVWLTWRKASASAAVRPQPSAAPRTPRIRPRLPVGLADLGPPVIAAYTLSAFLAVNYAIPGRVSGDLSLYAVQPALWGFLALISLLFIWKGTNSKVFSPGIAMFGLWAAAFQVAVLFGAGLIYGFGHSLYAREPVHMLHNGVYIVTLIAGVECSRAYIIGRFYPLRPFAALFVVSVLYALLVIPASNYHLLGSTRTGFQLAGETLMPALAVSVLASYLAARGGFLPAFIYVLGVQAFEWFSPILPNMEWTVSAFVETTTPLVCLLAIRGAAAEAIYEPRAKFDVSAPWVIASMAIVALFWFNAGLLGVKPEVVTGVSMEPALHTGDMVIVREVGVEDLEVGDIIQFKAGNTRVFHRIIEVEKTPNGLVFVTKGDNNNTADDPLVEDQVEGKIIFEVPDVGWLPLKMNQALGHLR